MIHPRLRAGLLVLTGSVVAAFFLFPYFVMVLTAMKPSNELVTIPPRLFPSTWRWENFGDVFHVAPIGQNLKISLIVASLSTLITISAALPAAHYTARNRFRGRRLFLAVILATQMFSPIVLVIGLYREFVQLGLVDTYWALVITNAAFNLGVAIWVLHASFQAIPVELEDAARVDGSSRLGAMARVALPLALPGVATAAIICFIAAWNEYVIALTLINSPGNQPLTLGVTSFFGRQQVEWQFAFATCVLAIIPVVVLFGLIERHLRGGLAAVR
jgi:multiple sugar transport system permease protein